MEFDNYPVKCQAAIVDLVFNLGSLRGFPTFKSAIQGLGTFKNKSMAERWTVVAKESRRPELSSLRNTEVQQWLLSATK